jgi:glycosyltransferase involved in cell wall biosynthesis
VNKGAFLFPIRLVWWTITFQLRRQLQLRRDYRLIVESGLFDALFYLRQNEDVTLARIDPLSHYLTVGGREKRDPHPLFDTHWYLQQNPDLTAAEANPLLHYLIEGWRKGSSPHPLFDTSFYLRRNPDIAQAGTEPLRHYLTAGGREGRDPHPLFDSSWYLEQNPDVASSGNNPLLHYLQQGSRERRDPHPLFDSGFYLHHNLDVAASRANPLLHYLQQGWKRRRNPHPLFDIEFYLHQRPDLATGSTDPLRHYLCNGANEGIDPCELFDSSFYLEQYPRVAEAGLNPLAHFWIYGAAEYCNPNPLFDTRFYLDQYPAVAAAGINPLLDFMASGARQGRLPNLFFDPTFYLRNNADVKGSGVNPLAHYLRIGARESRDPGPFFSTARYLSQHPELKDSDVNPLVHFLGSSQRTGNALATDSGSMQPLDATEARTVVSIAQANEALRSAAQTGSHLLVFLESVELDNETVERLVKAFDLDPHFGIAIPRQCHPATGEILALSPDLGDPQIRTLPRQILPKLPNYYILPEVLGSCFVLRDSVVSNFELLDESYDTLRGAFQHYIWRVRRCGFRSVVVNDVTATAAEEKSWLASVSGRDLLRLHTEHPDFRRAQMQFINHPLHRHESLLARGLSREKSLRQTLLIDARGLPTEMSGTVEAVLGVCDGLRQLDSEWTVTLLASPGPAEFHQLSHRYSDWEIIGEENDRRFTAAIRPSQPWNIASMTELHDRALFNFYVILDTISWDILFVAPPGLEAAWNFLSKHSDGILYISQYTRDRFAARFPTSRDIPGYVSHLSFDPDEYRCKSDEAELTDPSKFVLVVGNTYDHKNVGPTVDLLASALSGLRIKALGLETHLNPCVDCLQSGRIPQAEMDRLFAQAAIIVFPSFYEGFGLPVLKGLSYGRTVIARHSDLLLEIASLYRGPGRLISFRNPQELIGAVERVIRGSEIAAVPVGSALCNTGKPCGWKEIAAGILQFIEQQTQDVSRSRWLTRQAAIEQLDAYSN